MSKRENILANIASELAEIPNVTVRREVQDPSTDRLKNIWGESTYLLVLLDGEEECEVKEKGTRSYLNKLNIEINGYVKEQDNPSVIMNVLLAVVRLKMEEDYLRGGNSKDTQRLNVSILPELEPPYAGFKIRYVMRYFE